MAQASHSGQSSHAASEMGKMFVELELAPPPQKQSEMDRTDSRAVLVPAGAESSAGPNNKALRLPTSVKPADTTEGAQSPHPPRPPRVWRWKWDPLQNWRGWTWREFFYLAGPALLMAVAYLDPGNLEADVQAGATVGMILLWFFGLCFLTGYMFQCMTARLGVVTGRDLAALCGGEYSMPVRILVWLIIEVGIVGADIQETVGSAIAISLLSAGYIPLWAGCLIISVAAFVVLLLERVGARHLEAVFGGLIGLMAVSMGVNYVRAGVPQDEVLLGLVWPRLPRTAISVAVGALGALVMPHNIYFHSAIVNARNVERGSDQRKRLLLSYCHVESAVVLIVAFCINLFVVCVFAHGFYGTPNADDLGLESAGLLLGEKYGIQYKYMWALGLLASGLSSTITLTYSGQIVMAGFLRYAVTGWKRMVVTRLVALVPAVTVAVVFEANQKFDALNQLLNIVQSIVLPFALIPLIYIASKSHLLGDAFTTSRPIYCLASLIALSVMAINGYQLVNFMKEDLPQNGVTYSLFPMFMALYFGFALYLMVGPERWRQLYRLVKERATACGPWVKEKVAAVRESAKTTRWADPASVMEVHI